MRPMFWTLGSLFGLVVHILVANQLSLFSVKPHLSLVIPLILTLRNQHFFIVFLALLVGAIIDSLSHQYLGIYALSWLLISSLAYALASWIETQNLVTIAIPMTGLLLLEKVLSLTLFNIVIPETQWQLFLFRYTLPSFLAEFAFLIMVSLCLPFFEKR